MCAINSVCEMCLFHLLVWSSKYFKSRSPEFLQSRLPYLALIRLMSLENFWQFAIWVAAYCHVKLCSQMCVFVVWHLVSDKFADKNWRVHPDWVYCEYNYAGSPNREFATPEDNTRHFVGRTQSRGWNWGTPSVIPLPKCTNKEQFDPNCFKCKIFAFDDWNSRTEETMKSITHSMTMISFGKLWLSKYLLLCQ